MKITKPDFNDQLCLIKINKNINGFVITLHDLDVSREIGVIKYGEYKNEFENLEHVKLIINY